MLALDSSVLQDLRRRATALLHDLPHLHLYSCVFARSRVIAATKQPLYPTMREHRYFVYILSNKHRTVLYIGVTNSIERRVFEHRTGASSGFTKTYQCTELVWYEEFNDITIAIAREKQLKRWHRKWKFNLIRANNPTLTNLAEDWTK
jgi:putative endonuclease